MKQLNEINKLMTHDSISSNNKCCTHKTFAWIEFPWEVFLYKNASEAAALFLDAA